MIPGHVRIFVCSEPVDMRFGFDRLVARIRDELKEDPQSGSLFIFANRRATRLKVLWCERHGLCMLYKRLHRASFEVPSDGRSVAVTIDAQQLRKLLEGIPRGERPRKSR